MYNTDQRTVITLDAGGTNFVFGAIRGNEDIIRPIALPSNAHNLDLCLHTLEQGFREVIHQLDTQPVAISFAFPGPADYPNGIIGGWLPNFPSFRNGVALGPFLEEKFGIPVFINNDADLFAYGEALAGALPEINGKLEQLNSAKRYRNLLGYTWGTGFGFGFTVNGQLHTGDNSCVETFCLRNKKYPDVLCEDGVSIHALKREYAKHAGLSPDAVPEPKVIFDIAEGKREGNREAAVKAFAEYGEIAGDAMATAATLIDGLIVIGGGITAARKYIMPALLQEMRGTLRRMDGEQLSRLQCKVYDLDNADEFIEFAKGESRELKVHGSEKSVVYDPVKRIGITISKLGANRAIALGAYTFALQQIDR